MFLDNCNGSRLTHDKDLDGQHDNAIDDSEDEGHDPTGGRGLKSDMDQKLKGKEKESELLDAAV